jgi:glycosyltransferase involved in cell wall biosynthesis
MLLDSGRSLPAIAAGEAGAGMSGRAKRVLHVVRAMNRGGVETWLMHLLRHADPRRVQFDFLVHTNQPAAFDAEIEALGARLIRCPEDHRVPGYGQSVLSSLRAAGPYDAVHSHVHHFSGYILRLARRAGIPQRIAHSHSDTSRLDHAAGWPRRCYLSLTRHWIYANATELLAASRLAADALFGEWWAADRRSRLLHCGIDLAPFADAVLSDPRPALGIDRGDFVIGHVGRFDTPKNHAFLLEVAAAVLGVRPRARLLLVGGGPLLPAITARLEELCLLDRTTLAGVRPDVANLMAAMDVFVFPSIWEGLPLTLLEAQAAGLPCVISDVITDEAVVLPHLTRRLSLREGPRAWADAVLDAGRVPRRPAEARARVEQSSFSISHCLDALYELYAA